MFKIICLFCASIFLAELSQANPKIEIYDGDQETPYISEMYDDLKVKADKTSVNVLTGQAELTGNVVITSFDKRGYTVTYGTEKARISNADAEFQITDMIKADFADGSAFVNRASVDGHIEGYAQGVFLQGLENYSGWKRYRLHYHGVGAGAATDGNIAFDAENQTLKIRESIAYSDAKTVIDERIYSGVNRAILEQSIRNSPADKTDKFRNLTRYGAKLQSSSMR